MASSTYNTKYTPNPLNESNRQLVSNVSSKNTSKTSHGSKGRERAAPLFHRFPPLVYVLTALINEDEQSATKLSLLLSCIYSLRSLIMTTSQSNHALEREISQLDHKIKLIIQQANTNIQSQQQAAQKSEAITMVKMPYSQRLFLPYIQYKQELPSLQFLPTNLANQQKLIWEQICYVLQQRPHILAFLARCCGISNGGDQLVEMVVLELMGDQDDTTQERLLIELFSTALRAEFLANTDKSSLLRTNSPLTQMLSTFARRGKGIGILKKVLQEPIQLICDDTRSMDISFESCLKASGKEATGDYQGRMTMSVLPKEAIDIYYDRVNAIKEHLNRFLTSIVSSVALLPKGVRWVARYLYYLSLYRWPDDDNDHFPLIIVGGFVCLRYFNPCVVSPQVIEAINQEPNVNSKRALMLVAKVIQNVSNCTLFKSNEPSHLLLNDFVQSWIPKMRLFLRQVTDVSDFTETLSLNKYLAHSGNASIIQTSLSNLYNLQRLLWSHFDSVCIRYIEQTKHDDEEGRKERREKRLLLQRQQQQSLELSAISTPTSASHTRSIPSIHNTSDSDNMMSSSQAPSPRNGAAGGIANNITVMANAMPHLFDTVNNRDRRHLQLQQQQLQQQHQHEMAHHGGEDDFEPNHSTNTAPAPNETTWDPNRFNPSQQSSHSSTASVKSLSYSDQSHHSGTSSATQSSAFPQFQPPQSPRQSQRKHRLTTTVFNSRNLESILLDGQPASHNSSHASFGPMKTSSTIPIPQHNNKLLGSGYVNDASIYDSTSHSSSSSSSLSQFVTPSAANAIPPPGATPPPQLQLSHHYSESSSTGTSHTGVDGDRSTHLELDPYDDADEDDDDDHDDDEISIHGESESDDFLPNGYNPNDELFCELGYDGEDYVNIVLNPNDPHYLEKVEEVERYRQSRHEHISERPVVGVAGLNEAYFAPPPPSVASSSSSSSGGSSTVRKANIFSPANLKNIFHRQKSQNENLNAIQNLVVEQKEKQRFEGIVRENMQRYQTLSKTGLPELRALLILLGPLNPLTSSQVSQLKQHSIVLRPKDPYLENFFAQGTIQSEYEQQLQQEEAGVQRKQLHLELSMRTTNKLGQHSDSSSSMVALTSNASSTSLSLDEDAAGSSSSYRPSISKKSDSSSSRGAGSHSSGATYNPFAGRRQKQSRDVNLTVFYNTTICCCDQLLDSGLLPKINVLDYSQQRTTASGPKKSPNAASDTTQTSTTPTHEDEKQLCVCSAAYLRLIGDNSRPSAVAVVSPTYSGNMDPPSLNQPSITRMESVMQSPGGLDTNGNGNHRGKSLISNGINVNNITHCDALVYAKLLQIVPFLPPIDHTFTALFKFSKHRALNRTQSAYVASQIPASMLITYLKASEEWVRINIDSIFFAKSMSHFNEAKSQRTVTELEINHDIIVDGVSARGIATSVLGPSSLGALGTRQGHPALSSGVVSQYQELESVGIKLPTSSPFWSSLFPHHMPPSLRVREVHGLLRELALWKDSSMPTYLPLPKEVITLSHLSSKNAQYQQQQQRQQQHPSQPVFSPPPSDDQAQPPFTLAPAPVPVIAQHPTHHGTPEVFSTTTTAQGMVYTPSAHSPSAHSSSGRSLPPPIPSSQQGTSMGRKMPPHLGTSVSSTTPFTTPPSSPPSYIGSTRSAAAIRIPPKPIQTVITTDSIAEFTREPSFNFPTVDPQIPPHPLFPHQLSPAGPQQPTTASSYTDKKVLASNISLHHSKTPPSSYFNESLSTEILEQPSPTHRLGNVGSSSSSIYSTGSVPGFLPELPSGMSSESLHHHHHHHSQHHQQPAGLPDIISSTPIAEIRFSPSSHLQHTPTSPTSPLQIGRSLSSDATASANHSHSHRDSASGSLHRLSRDRDGNLLAADDSSPRNGLDIAYNSNSSRSRQPYPPPPPPPPVPQTSRGGKPAQASSHQISHQASPSMQPNQSNTAESDDVIADINFTASQAAHPPRLSLSQASSTRSALNTPASGGSPASVVDPSFPFPLPTPSGKRFSITASELNSALPPPVKKNHYNRLLRNSITSQQHGSLLFHRSKQQQMMGTGEDSNDEVTVFAQLGGIFQKMADYGIYTACVSSLMLSTAYDVIRVSNPSPLENRVMGWLNRWLNERLSNLRFTLIEEATSRLGSVLETNVIVNTYFHQLTDRVSVYSQYLLSVQAGTSMSASARSRGKNAGPPASFNDKHWAFLKSAQYYKTGLSFQMSLLSSTFIPISRQYSFSKLIKKGILCMNGPELLKYQRQLQITPIDVQKMKDATFTIAEIRRGEYIFAVASSKAQHLLPSPIILELDDIHRREEISRTLWLPSQQKFDRTKVTAIVSKDTLSRMGAMRAFDKLATVNQQHVQSLAAGAGTDQADSSPHQGGPASYSSRPSSVGSNTSGSAHQMTSPSSLSNHARTDHPVPPSSNRLSVHHNATNQIYAANTNPLVVNRGCIYGLNPDGSPFAIILAGKYLCIDVISLLHRVVEKYFIHRKFQNYEQS